MKKICLILFVSVLMLSAILTSRAVSRSHNLQEKSPRMKCLEDCQNSHNACLANAKDSKGNSDPSKVSACTKALNDCLKACPQNP